MSRRRILTAREQLEMLSPWREASAPNKIYRGIRLTNLPPELHQRIDELQQLPMHEGEIGQHLKIGPMLLDHLHNTPWKPFSQTPDQLQYTGLGRHWSRRKEFAELAASNQVGPGMSVVLEADDPGEQYYDPDRPMTGGYGPDDPHEQENTLLPNTPLNITSIRLPRKPFEEVLDDPYYHNMEKEYGHPYPGGPRPGIGGVAHDPFAKKEHVRQAMEPNIKWDSRPTDEEDLEAAWSEEPHPFHVNLPVNEVAKYANPDNIYDREGYRRLHDDVARSGEIRSPIVIETDGRRGWIDDGHHRLRVAQELGLDQVPVSVRRMARDDYPWASGGKWVPGELGAGLSDFIQKNPNFQEGWVRYRGPWPDRTASQHVALSEDEGQKMREVYAPHDPANPPEHLKPHLMLPIGAAHHYREYDRPYDDVLGQVIADQGIRQPLRISTDGTHATMHEGNHRLEIAKRLGLTHVPVQVTLEKPGEVIHNGGRPPAPLEKHLGEWVDQNRHRLKSFWS